MRKEGSRNRNKMKRKASAKRRRNLHKRKFEENAVCELQGEDGVDRISQLPNDILISIISRLTLREATSTSILSSRWRYLHTYVTHLDFPTFDPKVYTSFLLEFQHRKFLNHVNMINGVLDSHNGGGLVKELKLHMYKMKGGSINKWVEFAFTKEIETIEIAMLQPPYVWPQRVVGHYKFRLSKLILSKRGQPLPSLKCLKQLTLIDVDVTSQDFALLVSNFLALETLCLGCCPKSKSIKQVSIVGHPNLKHFEIHFPWRIVESFEIRNVMNLLSLRIYTLGYECALRLENIPKLEELCTDERGRYSRRYDELFGDMPSCICDQLQRFHFNTTLTSPNSTRPDMRQPLRLLNMKYLELVLESLASALVGVYLLFPLFEACLSLEKLKIKFNWMFPELIETQEREVPRFYSKKLPYLKVFEMEQYIGCQSDLQIAAHVINYAPNLEQVSVVVCDQNKRIRREALARAQQDFQKITPTSVHLRIT